MRTMTPEQFWNYAGGATRRDKGIQRGGWIRRLYKFYTQAWQAPTLADLVQVAVESSSCFPAVRLAAAERDAGKEQVIVPEYQEEQG